MTALMIYTWNGGYGTVWTWNTELSSRAARIIFVYVPISGRMAKFLARQAARRWRARKKAQ